MRRLDEPRQHESACTRSVNRLNPDGSGDPGLISLFSSFKYFIHFIDVKADEREGDGASLSR